jgi:molecular chaperone DnaK (HSP70)
MQGPENGHQDHCAAQLLNRPAVSLCGAGQDADEGRTVHVYNLGGDTFDVSVLQVIEAC